MAEGAFISQELLNKTYIYMYIIRLTSMNVFDVLYLSFQRIPISCVISKNVRKMAKAGI